jgi:hypothetical protein
MRGRVFRQSHCLQYYVSCHNIQDIYVLHVVRVKKYMYIQHIQGLGQSRLSTPGCALSLVASATTAV